MRKVFVLVSDLLVAGNKKNVNLPGENREKWGLGIILRWNLRNAEQAGLRTDKNEGDLGPVILCFHLPVS